MVFFELADHDFRCTILEYCVSKINYWDNHTLKLIEDLIYFIGRKKIISFCYLIYVKTNFGAISTIWLFCHRISQCTLKYIKCFCTIFNPKITYMFNILLYNIHNFE